jgi:L-lactate dehydrogenase complex protein LldG
MTERENILGRIREALTVEAPLPAQHGTGKPAAIVADRLAQMRRCLPAVDDSFESRLAAFRDNAVMLKAGFVVAKNRDDLRTKLRELCHAEGWKKIATHAGELAEFAARTIGLPAIKTDSGYDANELEACDAGITECDALVAQTGSVLVTSRSAGGRALSVLPPHHVVLARREQLVRDLPAAFELLRHKYGTDFPSMISFITGPSRTGDIERTLVLGAHGPKKLSVFLPWG